MSGDESLGMSDKNPLARRLAALMMADVAGYTRLMSGDEDATMEAWWSHRREVIDPQIAAHGGTIVKHTGDGFLAEFSSVLEAANCAVAVQTEMAVRNEGIAAERRMDFRIGINLGDIMADHEDIYGDGVNIAARLEALAEPGGICVSGSVYEQIRSKPNFNCQSMGEQQVKNIAEPVRTYRLVIEGAGEALTPAAPAVASVAPVTAPVTPAAAARTSIAVLPFDNMSNDPEQEYFSDGITEDIITDLSKISGLFVIARNSVFTYKGRNVKVPEVCAELGVSHALEGSIRKAGNRVRINAQLIDGSTGGHVWAERFDRQLDDIFAVQDEVTAEIVGALKVELSPQEESRVLKRGTDSHEAYDNLLRCRELMYRGTKDANLEALTFIERALEIDPHYAMALAARAVSYITQYTNQWTDDPAATLAEADATAARAMALDSEEPIAHLAVGVVRMWQNRLGDTVAAAKKILALDPNNSDGYKLLANSEHYAGNSQRAIEAAEKSMLLDPYYPDLVLQFLGQACFMAGDLDRAADVFRRRILRNPNTDTAHLYLAAIHGHQERPEEAQAEWAELLNFNPKYSLAERMKIWPYADPALPARIVDGLTKGGITTDA
ncbi:MAG: adenylate/guanylate cyclase domain-containing protein [Alphaproteobacteria bacterium]|jgi:TolB-like protein/class 3 adenylate cyclase|nr:adenylate/guanylate cyclase domain-containing protein [Alphaproteobacteria bacterium]